MKVRKLDLSDGWVLYYIIDLNVYVDEDQLNIIAEHREELPDVVEETYCSGYLKKELKHAIALDIDKGINQ